MPALLGAGPVVVLHVRLLLGGCHLRSLARIEAYRDDVIILARGQGEILHAANQAVENHVAQRRALVINQRQNHRLSEILTQRDELPGLVVEGQIERHLRAHFLIDADSFQQGDGTIASAPEAARSARRIAPQASNDNGIERIECFISWPPLSAPGTHAAIRDRWRDRSESGPRRPFCPSSHRSKEYGLP